MSSQSSAAADVFQNDKYSGACNKRYNLCLLVYYFPLCALFSPVPEIRWKKIDGHLPSNHEVRMTGTQLHLYNVQFEDGGTYKCEAINSKGKDYHTARVSVEGNLKFSCLNLYCSFAKSLSVVLNLS